MIAAFQRGVLALCTMLMAIYTQASVVQYQLTTSGPLFSTSLDLLSEVTDTSAATYLPEYGGYIADGSASGHFKYDNQTGGQYLALLDTSATLGSYIATSNTGGLIVADGTFNPSVPYDPTAPLVDAVSLHLGNAGTPGFEGFELGDWVLVAIAASWMRGEFVSGNEHPETLPPRPGYEHNVLTFIFENHVLGETSYITASDMQVHAVPLPAAAWLFFSALAGLSLSRARR